MIISAVYHKSSKKKVLQEQRSDTTVQFGGRAINGNQEYQVGPNQIETKIDQCNLGWCAKCLEKKEKKQLCDSVSCTYLVS